MEINEIYRRQRPYNPKSEYIDGYKNFFSITAHPNNLPMIDMGSGIYKPKSDLNYEPAIFISSSPHKYGSETTPWQDVIRSDLGHIKYFGDNKIDKKQIAKDPEIMKGNKYLLEQFKLHSSNILEDRKKAAPILCFRSEEVNGKKKGYISFQGVCIIERVELVTQIDPKTNKPFTNYCFDLLVITLKHEHEQFNFEWINERRSNPKYDQTLKHAPKAWRQWVNGGNVLFNSIRRNVLQQFTCSTASQIPPQGSQEEIILKKIYEYYGGSKSNTSKHRFESLAAVIAERVINQKGGKFNFGWVTQGTNDNAIDFVGRLDIGSDFATTKLIVLGQAKCEKLSSPTNGQHIARTVSRLKRGWIGVYVTTSYFSENVQLEILDDNFPIILIDGYRVSSELRTMMIENGEKDIQKFIQELDAEYESKIMKRQPEEILFM